jgi:hypothetical protein
MITVNLFLLMLIVAMVAMIIVMQWPKSPSVKWPKYMECDKGKEEVPSKAIVRPQDEYERVKKLFDEMTLVEYIGPNKGNLGPIPNQPYVITKWNWSNAPHYSTAEICQVHMVGLKRVRDAGRHSVPTHQLQEWGDKNGKSNS